MTPRARVAMFVLLALVAAAAAGGYALQQRGRYEERTRTAPEVALAADDAFADRPRIVFRHTGLDSHYGTVATVALEDPGGARSFTDVACDRVAAWDGGASCLLTERGVAAFRARELGPDWEVTQEHPLPGIPSRTRVSPSGRLVATTSFVTGHSYLTTGFSTATVVREVGGGRTWGDLEEFTLELDGREVEPVDRNVWGVTFVDDRRFYATVATGGRAWVVAGDLSRRTLTSVTEGGECPSLSPDGSRLAFKVTVPGGDSAQGTRWSLAVLDLASGRRTDLGDGPLGVDDQVAWLDDDTLLYGMPRADEPGATDVWAIEARAGAVPRLLVEEAWSPTVVRPGGAG